MVMAVPVTVAVATALPMLLLVLRGLLLGFGPGTGCSLWRRPRGWRWSRLIPVATGDRSNHLLYGANRQLDDRLEHAHERASWMAATFALAEPIKICAPWVLFSTATGRFMKVSCSNISARISTAPTSRS